MEATMVVDDHDLRCVLLNIVVVFATKNSSSSTTTTAIVVEAALVEGGRVAGATGSLNGLVY